MSYIKREYRDRIDEIFSRKPGDLSKAIIAEESVIGSKKQFVAILPKYLNNVGQYSGKSDLEEEYNRRTAGKEFHRIEQIGLISHLPMASTKKKHHILVNPDVQNELKNIGQRKFSIIDLPSNIEESKTEGLNIRITNNRSALNDINEASKAAAEAMMWYAGREIGKTKDDYPQHFGMETLLFGHIAIFLEEWRESDPEISFSKFGKKGPDGYRIDGEFSSSYDQLRFKSDFAPEVEEPLKRVVEDRIRSLLVSLLRYASFNPDEVTNRGVRNGNVEPGNGRFEYKTLTPEAIEEYEELSPTEYNSMSDDELRDVFETESRDWSTYNLVDQLTARADVQGGKIDFELELSPTV